MNISKYKPSQPYLQGCRNGNTDINIKITWRFEAKMATNIMIICLSSTQKENVMFTDVTGRRKNEKRF